MPASKTPTFYVYRDDAKEYRWRLRAGNGKIVADSGEGYKTMRALNHAIGIVQGQASSANTVYLT